jgi:integrase
MLAYRGRDPSRVYRIEFWKALLNKTPVLEISPDQIDAGVIELESRPALTFMGRRQDGSAIYRPRKGPLTAKTINGYLAILGAVFTWARKRRLLPRQWVSPLKEVHREPADKLRLRFLSAQEYERLLLAARVSTWPRLRLLIMLAVTTGVCKGTLKALRWRDVDFEKGRALVERTKNDTPHTLVLVPEVLAELRRFSGKPDEFVFPSQKRSDRAFNWEKPYKLALEDAGIEGAVFHTLRHTHASWLASHGASLLQIAESMNHKSLRMAQRYAHLTVDNRAALVTKVFG